MCDRLPTPGGDRQARLLHGDCAAVADAVGPMAAVSRCASPACVRKPAAAVVEAIERSHRVEVALARTVSGTCHATLADSARYTARAASAWRSILRAARSGSPDGVLRGLAAYIDASIEGAALAKRLPTCAP